MMLAPSDIRGTLLVGVISVVLFITAMGALVLLGHDVGADFYAERMAEIHAGKNAAPESGDGIAGFDASGPQPGEVPVLCYHYLRGRNSPLRIARVFAYVVLSLPVVGDNEIWTVTRSAFESQMRYLHDHGYQTITLDELTAWQEGRTRLPSRPVVITFDDGDRSVYRYAWPVLQRYGMRATLFIVTGQVGHKWAGLHMLHWYELREMTDSGAFDIESHTHNLHYKITTRMGTAPVCLAAQHGWTRIAHNPLWRDAVARDLTESRRLIRRHIGSESRYLAWPYGLGSAGLDSVAAQVGLIRGAEMMGGSNELFPPVAGNADSTDAGARVPSRDPLRDSLHGRAEINRYAVTAHTSLRDFGRMLRGEYDPAP